MSDWRIGDTVEFKQEAGLGGWMRGQVIDVLDGGRKIEVRAKHARAPVVVRASRVREAKADYQRREIPALPVRERALSDDDGDAPSLTAGNPVVRAVMAKRAALLVIDDPYRPQPKEQRWRHNGYMVFVRMHRCLGCATLTAPREAHHDGPRGMGQKADDYHTVPLCSACHEARHHQGIVPGCEDRVRSDLAIAREQVRLLGLWLRGIESSAGSGSR